MRYGWILIVCLIVGGALNRASAKPEYLEVLTGVYKPYADKLSDRSCANCHVSVSDYALNPYGKQIAHELVAANTKTLTPDILQKVEIMSAFEDGASNLEKIKSGQAPGEAKVGSSAKSNPSASMPAPEPKKSIVPKNFFHPAIVHFPIALFIAGLFLDFLGWRKNQKSMLLAGWYNLVLAAVSAIGSIGSGLIAMFRMHLPFKGLIFTHLLLACLASVLMWILVGVRVHRHEKMSTASRGIYYVIAACTLILIAYSAHLGGAFVYGE